MELFLASGMHWKIFNFFVFVSALFVLLRKPVADFWRARAHQIAFDIEEARRLRQEAGKKVLELESRIKGLDDEVQRLIHSLRQEGIQEKKKILSDSKNYAEKLRGDAKRIVKQELQKTKEQLRRELVENSVRNAEKEIRGQIGEEDQSRLSLRFIKELEVRS
ncbi:MAG: ATP synthase F0 subunit B [Deltaproteobacteria bacterium]|nr:ATP synthase F0 subunit B [Deltaproteobacteria bacterium]